MNTKLNAKLWSEYLNQQNDLVDVMRELGYENHNSTAKQADKLNAQYIYCSELFGLWMSSDDTQPDFFTERAQPHYIACGGLHGCITSHCASHDTYESAIDDIVDTYDLTPVKVARLKADGYIELYMPRDGNEYAEIIECNCDDPSDHNGD